MNDLAKINLVRGDRAEADEERANEFVTGFPLTAIIS